MQETLFFVLNIQMQQIQTRLRYDGEYVWLVFVNVTLTYCDSTAEVVTAPGHLVDLTTRWS